MSMISTVQLHCHEDSPMGRMWEGYVEKVAIRFEPGVKEE